MPSPLRSSVASFPKVRVTIFEAEPVESTRQVINLGFARDGWTEASDAFAQEVARDQPGGKNWRAGSMRLFNLAQIDGDLAAWVG